MANGLFLVSRELFKHPVVGLHKPVWFAAWVWMLGEARWKDSKIDHGGKTIILRRGQLSHSLRFMSERLGMSVKGIRVFLTRLEKDTMIVTERGTVQTVITICKYEEYQDFEKYRAQIGARQRAQQGHSRGTAGAQTRTPDLTPDGTPDETPEDKAFGMWNDFADKNGHSKAQVLSNERKSKIKSRLKDCGGIEGWKTALEKVSASPGLTGGNKNRWKADLDFVLQKSSFIKIMEGKYDDWNERGDQRTSEDLDRAVAEGFGFSRP